MNLGHNWFYRPRLDIEMKQYEALAFIRYLETCLAQKIFLPPYQELSLQQTVIGQFLLQTHDERFLEGKTLEGIDWSKKDLKYSFRENHQLEEVEKIALFLYKRIKPFVKYFAELKAGIMNEINIERVGITPFYCGEGWLLLGRPHRVDVFLYRDKGVLDLKGQKNLDTTYYQSYDKTPINTPEAIKLDLVKQHKEFPNPATYFVNCVSTYPLETTYLPLVREKLVQQGGV